MVLCFRSGRGCPHSRGARSLAVSLAKGPRTHQRRCSRALSNHLDRQVRVRQPIGRPQEPQPADRALTTRRAWRRAGSAIVGRGLAISLAKGPRERVSAAVACALSNHLERGMAAERDSRRGLAIASRKARATHQRRVAGALSNVPIGRSEFASRSAALKSRSRRIVAPIVSPRMAT